MYLPAEIIHAILTRFSDSITYHDRYKPDSVHSLQTFLYKAVLINRNWNDVLTPVLYSYPTLNTPFSVNIFARTVSASKQLQVLVLKIHITDTLIDQVRFSTFRPKLAEKVRKKAKDFQDDIRSIVSSCTRLRRVGLNFANAKFKLNKGKGKDSGRTGILFLQTVLPRHRYTYIFALEIANLYIHSTLPFSHLMNLREIHFYQCSFLTDSVFGPQPTVDNTNSVNSNSPSSPSKTRLGSRTETKSNSSPAPSSAFSPLPTNPPSVTQLSFSSVSFESNVNIDNFFASIHSNLPKINSISLSFCAYRSSAPSPSTFQLFKSSKSSIRLWGLSLIGKEECRIFNDLRRVDKAFFEGFFYLTIGYIDEPDPLDPTGEHLLLDVSRWRLESKTMVRTSFWIHRLTLDSVAKIRRCLEASFSERPTKRTKTEVEVNTSCSAEKEKECGRSDLEDDDSEEEDSYYCRFWSTSTIQLLVDVSAKNDIVGWNLYQQLKDWCHSEYGRHISIDWIGIPSYLNSPS